MPSRKNTDIGIILVNWNCKEEILVCLESIRRAGYLENVVVVDNGSNDGSVEKIKNQISKVKIIENKQNLGFAEGNNRGIRYLLGNSFTPRESWLASPLQPATLGVVLPKYIFILNPDTQLKDNTIDKLIGEMEKYPDVGIAGPKILTPDKKNWSAGGIIDKKRYSGGLIGYGKEDKNFSTSAKNIVHEVDYIPGTAMMVRNEVFKKTGLFPKLYFMYYEDVEFSLKAKKAGFKILFVTSSVIIHNESSSIGKNSPVQEYYMARNHLLFVERNAPLRVKMRELVRLPKTIYEHARKGERWAIRGIGDYFIRRFGKWIPDQVGNDM